MASLEGCHAGLAGSAHPAPALSLCLVRHDCRQRVQRVAQGRQSAQQRDRARQAHPELADQHASGLCALVRTWLDRQQPRGILSARWRDLALAGRDEPLEHRRHSAQPRGSEAAAARPVQRQREPNAAAVVRPERVRGAVDASLDGRTRRGRLRERQWRPDRVEREQQQWRDGHRAQHGHVFLDRYERDCQHPDDARPRPPLERQQQRRNARRASPAARGARAPIGEAGGGAEAAASRRRIARAAFAQARVLSASSRPSFQRVELQRGAACSHRRRTGDDRRRGDACRQPLNRVEQDGPRSRARAGEGKGAALEADAGRLRAGQDARCRQHGQGQAGREDERRGQSCHQNHPAPHLCRRCASRGYEGSAKGAGRGGRERQDDRGCCCGGGESGAAVRLVPAKGVREGPVEGGAHDPRRQPAAASAPPVRLRDARDDHPPKPLLHGLRVRQRRPDARLHHLPWPPARARCEEVRKADRQRARVLSQEQRHPQR